MNNRFAALHIAAQCVINSAIMEVAQLKNSIAELKARVENIRDWL
jgi:hypothetical protein